MRRHPRGFTLVELLVASLLTGAVLTSVYFVFIANTRQYYTQEQMVQMQETMRFAIEYLKNDLRNAGQLAIVNGTAQNTDPDFCGPRSADLRALNLLDDDPAAAPPILEANGNGLRPDVVQILSDASGGTLLAATMAGATIRIQTAAEQISGRAMEIVDSEARFRAMYQPGAYLRVMAAGTGAFDLVPIAAVNFQAGGESIVTLARQPLCVLGSAESLRVNPVHWIRYRIIEDPNDVARTVLVRDLLDAGNPGAGIAGTELTVADFVVNLQIWATYDHRPAAVPQDPVISADADPTDDVGNFQPAPVDEGTAFNANPHRIRAIHLMLATRSSREDAELHVAPDRAVAANLRLPTDRVWFDVVPEAAGAVPVYARVTTMTARVDTPALLTEGNL
jgi:prepilin-type N-terminal cleavage/methylation domain-containing protein